MNREFKRDALSSINFGVNSYGRLKYLMRLTDLRKKDKRLKVIMAQPNISEKKIEGIKKERAELHNSMKIKFKELQRYDKSNKTKAVVGFVQFLNMKAQARFLKSMNVSWFTRMCSKKHEHK